MSPGEAPAPRFRGGGRLLRISLGLAAAGAILLLVGLFVAPRRVAFAYLTAYAYVVSIAVSGLLFLMICHAMGAVWPTVVRRLVEAMVKTLPLLGALFIPILVGLPALYPWTRPGAAPDERARRLLEHRLPYLNVPFFAIRTAIYFALWIGVGTLLCRWSERRDHDPSRPVSGKLKSLSAGALPLVGLAMAFASFD